MVVEKKGVVNGLLADALVGVQQVALKDLGELFEGHPMIAGGAVLRDGRVGLMLDVDGVLSLQ